jgi:serine/threonine protein kinase
VWRTDTLIRPILLLDYELPRSSSLINPPTTTTTFSFAHLPHNPEHPTKVKVPLIPTNNLLLNQEWRDGELEERTAFLLTNHTYAGLHAWKEERPLPSCAGLLGTWGACQLGTEGKRYYVSELHFGNSFRNLMNEFGKFEPSTAKHFLSQLIGTVNALHCQGFSHNRLSLDSICHDCEGNLLVNFFKASTQPISETESLAYFYYFPPEVLLGGEGGEKSDVWAIGCLCLQFLSAKSIRSSGRHPYNSSRLIGRQAKPSSLSDCLNGIIERRVKNAERRLEMEEISEAAHDLIGSCLQLREEMRPSLA